MPGRWSGARSGPVKSRQQIATVGGLMVSVVICIFRAAPGCGMYSNGTMTRRSCLATLYYRNVENDHVLWIHTRTSRQLSGGGVRQLICARSGLAVGRILPVYGMVGNVIYLTLLEQMAIASEATGWRP